MQLFNRTVREYKKAFKGLKGSALVFGPLKDKKAFFSLAPLSKALHDLGIDVYVSLYSKRSESNLPIIERVWKAYERKQSKEGIALHEFITYVEKKRDAKGFSKIFKRAELLIELKPNFFLLNKSEKLRYNAKWFRKYDERALKKTCRNIIENCYALKKRERFSISFELVPNKKMLELPLEDYLDNFAVAYHMAKEAKRFCRAVMLSASTARQSKLDMPERISELAITLAGCEYEKNIKEEPFKIFKKLSRLLKINELHYSDASFGIVGKGYHGKHIFGLAIGYPSPDKRTRWPSPAQMFLKPWWNEQSKIDKRRPKTRLAITETLPLEEFITTCNIDYSALRRRNTCIKKIIEASEKLIVEGHATKHGCTKLIVDLGKRKKRFVQRSDSDVRNKIDREVLKRFGILAGMYDNLPGGEVFFTPENITGIAIGDVVINIDRSYALSKKPLVVKFTRGRWKLLKAPSNVEKRIRKELRDVRKLIKLYEKNRALPKRVITSYKENFKRIGEFAINTNPKAKLSRYLIVNEKLANMIHIALGSGFEPDRQTLYHWDFVIDVPAQRISIKACDANGRERYIIKEGRFVI
jgi:leucyl aminopeptidase (aminopeptidase T)